MKKNPLISVIVPIYKVEKWLHNCVNSIIKQTYTNLEIILVDDESPDRCPEICDRLSRKDSRIKVVHQKNGGVSVARNTGIAMATGDFLCFVDSDDSLPKTAIENLYVPFLDPQIQYSVGVVRYFKTNRIEIQGDKQEVLNVDSSDGILEMLNSGMNCRSVWGKLYSTNVIKQNSIEFHAGIKCGEDMLFIMEYILHCTKIAFVREVVYNYNVLITSTATSKLYHELDDWMIQVFNAEKALFKNDTSDEIYFNMMKRALEYMELIFRHPVLHGVKKETCMLIYERNYLFYKNYIDNNILKDGEAFSSDFMYEYIRCCENNEYADIYDSLHKQYTVANTNKVKLTLKTLFVFLKQVHFKLVA